jgi:holo-[acyl-carrier protein] synthase
MLGIAHGIDLVHCPRIERIWRDHGELFLTRVYTLAERAYCLDCQAPVTRLAGRFAAKEAVLKALGTGWRGGIHWTDIETLPDALGKPVLTLRGATRDLAERLGLRALVVSISHAGEYAVASVVAHAG